MLEADVIECGDVLLGDDEHVMWRLRVDIVEGENEVVVVDDVGGNLTPDYFAEEAIVFQRHFLTPGFLFRQ